MSALDQESKTLAKGCAQDEMVCEPSSSCISGKNIPFRMG